MHYYCTVPRWIIYFVYSRSDGSLRHQVISFNFIPNTPPRLVATTSVSSSCLWVRFVSSLSYFCLPSPFLQIGLQNTWCTRKFETQTAYRTKTMVHQVPSTNTFCIFKKRKKLHRMPNAFWNCGDTRVMYSVKPFVISPNAVTCNSKTSWRN